MKEYVNGFMYSKDRKQIVLIKKNRPTWQRGLLNGVGGKIEDNETPEMAIVREFEEETGVATKESDWKVFAIIRKENEYQVYFFVSVTDKVFSVKTAEDQEVGIYNVHNLPTTIIPNLSWLIPLSLDEEVDVTRPIVINY